MTEGAFTFEVEYTYRFFPIYRWVEEFRPLMLVYVGPFSTPLRVNIGFHFGPEVRNWNWQVID